MISFKTFAKEKFLILLFTAILFFFFSSCGPSSGGAGSGGPITPNPPPNTAKPIVTAMILPTGQYNGNITGAFTVINPSGTGNVTVSVFTDNGTIVSVNGTQYTLHNVKGPTRVTISATNNNGTGYAYADANVHTQKVTDFCFSGIWKMKEVSINGILYPAGIICRPIQPSPSALNAAGYPGGTMVIFNSLCDGNPDGNTTWSFVGSDSIRLGQQATSPSYYLISLSSTEFKISFPVAVGTRTETWGH